MEDVWYLSHYYYYFAGNLTIIFQVGFALKMIIYKLKLLSLQCTAMIGICAAFFYVLNEKMFY